MPISVTVPSSGPPSAPARSADGVADPERAGEQQDHAREHVAQRLLRGDADENAGQRPAEDQLADRDVEQQQGDRPAW